MQKLNVFKSFLLASCMLLSSTLFIACNDDNTDSPSSITETPTNSEKAIAVLKAFQTGDITDLNKYLDSSKYIQHNLFYPDGAATVIGAVKSGAFNGTKINTVRSIADDDLVVLHSEYAGTWNKDTPQVVFDIFRFENGLIVEHWDNLANIQDDGDNTTQLNGILTPASQIEKTTLNRTLMQNFTQDFFLKGGYSDSIFQKYFNEKEFVQHSLNAGTNISGLKGFVQGVLKEGTPFYKTIEKIIVQGNFALTLSEGYPDQQTGVVSAYYDLFRIENEKIVEHWDVVQTIPAKEHWANNNGKW